MPSCFRWHYLKLSFTSLGNTVTHGMNAQNSCKSFEYFLCFGIEQVLSIMYIKLIRMYEYRQKCYSSNNMRNEVAHCSINDLLYSKNSHRFQSAIKHLAILNALIKFDKCTSGL